MALENCRVCRGTGWKLVPRSDGSAGKVAVACDCGMQDRAERVIERAHIPKRYEHCDFESYSTDVGATASANRLAEKSQAPVAGIRSRLSRRRRKRTCYSWARLASAKRISPSPPSKNSFAAATPASSAITANSSKKSRPATTPPANPPKWAFSNQSARVEILVLDDLGASKPSDWVRDIVGIVLNARYNERRTTIITTNYYDNPATEGEATRLPSGKLVMPTREDSLDQRIGSRMRSRLFEMCRTVEITAPDFRRESTQAGRARA